MAEPRRRRGIVLLAAATALAVGAVAAVAVVVGNSGVRSGGPLGCPECGYIASSIPIDVGKAGTYGIVVLRNPGAEAAVLDRVAYRRLTPGLQMLAPLALRRGDYHGIGLASGLTFRFPPPSAAGAARPLKGFPVRRHRTFRDDVEVLIGFRPRRKGVFSYEALDVYYHVGKRRYVATFEVALKVCAPSGPFRSGRRKCEARALG